MEEEDGDIGEDEMADFIIDEEEVDKHGAPVRFCFMNAYVFSSVLEISLE